MIMGYLLSDIAYLLAFLAYVAIFLLVLEWFVHFAPGAGLNPLRRGLFQWTFPLLRFSERYLSFRWGAFETRGLLLAFCLWALSRAMVTWIAWMGFSLRG